MTNTQPASPATSSRTRLGWVLGLTSTAYFMVVLDSSVVLTALPRMQRDLHAGLRKRAPQRSGKARADADNECRPVG